MLPPHVVSLCSCYVFWIGVFWVGACFPVSRFQLIWRGQELEWATSTASLRRNQKILNKSFFILGHSIDLLSKYEPPFSHSYIPFSLKVRWSTRSPYSFVLVCIAAPEEAGKVKFIIKIKLYIFTDSDQNLIIFISAQNLRFWSWILKIRFPAALGFVKHMFMWVRVPLTTELDSVLPGALCVSKE